MKKMRFTFWLLPKCQLAGLKLGMISLIWIVRIFVVSVCLCFFFSFFLFFFFFSFFFLFFFLFLVGPLFLNHAGCRTLICRFNYIMINNYFQQILATISYVFYFFFSFLINIKLYIYFLG